MKSSFILAGSVLSLFAAASALAYDGTVCKYPGNCWEPKPGYPQKVAGSQYDPQHDPAELNKQQESIHAMEARNRKRVEHMATTGRFVYNVEDLK